jgi:hypothetical protein
MQCYLNFSFQIIEAIIWINCYMFYQFEKTEYNRGYTYTQARIVYMNGKIHLYELHSWKLLTQTNDIQRWAGYLKEKRESLCSKLRTLIFLSSILGYILLSLPLTGSIWSLFKQTNYVEITFEQSTSVFIGTRDYAKTPLKVVHLNEFYIHTRVIFSMSFAYLQSQTWNISWTTVFSRNV